MCHSLQQVEATAKAAAHEQRGKDSLKSKSHLKACDDIIHLEKQSPFMSTHWNLLHAGLKGREANRLQLQPCCDGALRAQDRAQAPKIRTIHSD